jgi:hypothetical protein
MLKNKKLIFVCFKTENIYLKNFSFLIDNGILKIESNMPKTPIPLVPYKKQVWQLLIESSATVET